MKRQVANGRKRGLLARLKSQLQPKRKPKRSLSPKVTAKTIGFAVIGDSHVGYGNSSSIFRNLLPKAVSSGNKKFVIFGG